jgi:hydrophobe/amphiphile efflux-3 (HAE3) family protein
MERFLFQSRYLLATLALLLTIFFAYQATKIEFDLSPETIFIEDDNSYEFYKEIYLPQFAHLGTPGILAIEAKDKKQALLPAIKKAADKLSLNPHVKQVISAHDQKIFLPSPQGMMELPLVDEKEELTKEAKDYFNNHPLFKGVFLGKNDESMALTFLLDSKFQDQKGQTEAALSITDSVRELKQELPDYNLYLTGLPFIQSETINLLKTDQLRLLPLVIALLVILLLLMTKHPLGALYPLLIIFVALIWTVGFLSLMGHKINVINNAIVVLIMVIGIADSVHIYTRFIEESIRHRRLHKNPGKTSIIKDTIGAMLLPCFLTSATTGLGFVASGAANVEIIQQFGYDTAAGVGFCFLATFMLMPTLLSFHKIPKSHSAFWLKFLPKKLSIDNILQYAVSFSLRYAKFLSALAVVLIGLSIWASSGIKSKQNFIGELPKDDPAILALSFVEENFGGVMPFYIVFSGDYKKLDSYETAMAINNLANKLKDYSLKPTIRSPIDAVNFLLQKNPAPLDIKAIDADTYQELSLLVESANKIFWSKDKKHLRIEGFLANASTTEVEEFRKFIEKSIEELNLKDISVTTTGSAIISSRALHNITNDMKKSLALATLYITIFIAIFFRSIRYAIIAMLPNLLPIGLTIAFMSLLDIDVRLATVMIFSMSLGLSIDTCIHLLCRVQEEMKKMAHDHQKISLIRSIHRAFKGSGRPIIYTTAILLGGFSVLMFSRFLAMHDFAIISAIVIFAALIADIVLLPAFIWVTRARRKS